VLARACVLPLAAALFALAGCGPAKLEVNKTVTVDANDYNFIGLPKQPQPQKVTVEIEATQEVNVYVIDAAKEGNFPDLSPEKQAEAAKYGKLSGAKAGTVTAEVPENTEVTVAIGGGQRKADVKVSITNRK
jgi:hypothetical protein